MYTRARANVYHTNFPKPVFLTIFVRSFDGVIVAASSFLFFFLRLTRLDRTPYCCIALLSCCALARVTIARVLKTEFSLLIRSFYFFQSICLSLFLINRSLSSLSAVVRVPVQGYARRSADGLQRKDARAVSKLYYIYSRCI